MRQLQRRSSSVRLAALPEFTPCVLRGRNDWELPPAAAARLRAPRAVRGPRPAAPLRDDPPLRGLSLSLSLSLSVSLITPLLSTPQLKSQFEDPFLLGGDHVLGSFPPRDTGHHGGDEEGKGESNTGLAGLRVVREADLDVRGYGYAAELGVWTAPFGLARSNPASLSPSLSLSLSL